MQSAPNNFSVGAEVIPGLLLMLAQLQMRVFQFVASISELLIKIQTKLTFFRKSVVGTVGATSDFKLFTGTFNHSIEYV